jgi:hypothetical protein
MFEGECVQSGRERRVMGPDWLKKLEWVEKLAQSHPSRVWIEMDDPERGISKEEKNELFSMLTSGDKISVWGSQHSDSVKSYIWGLISEEDRIKGAMDRWSDRTWAVIQALSDKERAILERRRRDHSVAEEEGRRQHRHVQEQSDYCTAMREKPPRDDD